MLDERFFSLAIVLLAGAICLGQQADQLPRPRQEPSTTTAPKEPSSPAATTPTPPLIPQDGSITWDGQGGPLESPIAGEIGTDSFQNFWVSGEYLLWTIREAHIPGLVSLIPPDGPSSRVFGAEDVNHDMHSGGRLTVGYWWDASQQVGLEAAGLFLAERSVDFSGTSAPLARPFSNVNTGNLDFVQVSSPGVVAGGVTVHYPSELWGAEANAVKTCYVYDNTCVYGMYFKASALAGLRYLHLRENLDINQVASVLSDSFNGFPGLAGDQLSFFDHFGTRNDFYGAQVGGDLYFQYKDLFVDLRGKVAIGATTEEINIKGSQILVTPDGQATTFAGGLLALPTNMGNFHKDRLAFAPEFNVNVGYDVSQHVSLFVGYDFLFWSQVARPGDQIDAALDVNNIPNHEPAPASGQARPAPTLRQTEVFTQGVNFGIAFQW